jgi:predicted RNA binding protein YcfA (HicA-like mRNA interferase family)
MGRLYADLRRILLDAGCRCVRQAKGSHEIWHSPVSGRRFSVPATIKSTHLANAILKQAGLDKAF